MQLTMSRDRFFNDRRSLLGKLDRIRRQVDSSGELEAMDELQRQAYELLLGGGVSRALDLHLLSRRSELEPTTCRTP